MDCLSLLLLRELQRTVNGTREGLLLVTNNSPSRDYFPLDDQTTQTTETPGFSPFTVFYFLLVDGIEDKEASNNPCKGLSNLSVIIGTLTVCGGVGSVLL